MTTDRWGWYAQRLRTMGPTEIAWRTGRAVRSRLPRRGVDSWDDATLLGTPAPDWAFELEQFRAGTGRPILLSRERAAEVAAELDPTELLEAADRAAEQRFAFFGYPEVQLPTPLDWSHDPLAGVTWPDAPARQIDHRTAAGDVKWIWELNRLQHLPVLSTAWLVSGDDRYARAALDQLDSWLLQNPPGHGIAWRGAFEAGIRAVSVAIALDGLKDSPELTPDRFRRAVRMLAASADRCWTERSLHSSANNHLVGELAGLATVALMFPRLARASAWERRSLRLLSCEADRQVLPDGSGAEQSVGYQISTTELLLVVALLLKRRGGAVPPALTSAVSRGARFLADVVGDHDPQPRYGDDDQGFALRLGPEPTRSVREHLAVVGGFTGDPTLWARGTRTFTAAWFTEGPPSGDPEPPPAGLHAADGGLVVLRSGDRRVTMDIGPLGYLSIAAHGHADALAVTVSHGGHDVLGDPGTASYYGHPDWRRTHRGTRTHATVCVDGQDQSVMGGPFLWSRHAQVRLRSVDLEAGIVDAEHDGYERLDSPVVHRRWLLAPPAWDHVLVVDLLTGAGRHDVEVTWPLAPGFEATTADGRHRADDGTGSTVSLHHAATHRVALEQSRGDDRTQLGWWSTRLEQREPSWRLASRTRGDLPLAVATLLSLQTRAEIEVLSVRVDDRVVAVHWTEEGRERSVALDRARAGVATWQG